MSIIVILGFCLALGVSIVRPFSMSVEYMYYALVVGIAVGTLVLWGVNWLCVLL